MGYPVITRLGINQFWYKHWYSDINYGERTKLSNLMPKILKLYLRYGLTTSSDVFFNKFFFNKKVKNINTGIYNKNLKFFRKFFYSNKLLNIEHSYLLRIKTGEYFPLRVWLISYENWLVLCFSCYKPVKTSRKTNLKIKKELNSISLYIANGRVKPLIKRFKLTYTYILSYLAKNYNYSF